MVRIISGKYRSLKFLAPDKDITRITKDRIRESIFNIISYQLENTIVLDGFAGSGIIGGEFLSRGCKKLISIEKNPSVFLTTKQNLESLKSNDFTLINDDLNNYLLNSNIIFDYIYLDPPYKEYELIRTALNIIVNRNLLNKTGTIIVETNTEIDTLVPKELKIKKIKKYSNIFIFFLENNF
ncbi:MAG: 16S rRNA (guanine(966)-N(2))-methyltransferase RsmD [Metamycoplasmataceae bacterium]